MSEEFVFKETIERKLAENIERGVPLYTAARSILWDLINQAKDVRKEEKVTPTDITQRTYRAIIEPLILATGYSGVEIYVLSEYEEFFESTETESEERAKKKLLELGGGVKFLRENSQVLILEDKILIPCIGNLGLTRKDVGIGRPTNEKVLVGYITFDKPKGFDQKDPAEREEEVLFWEKYGKRAGPGLHERKVMDYIYYKLASMAHELNNPLLSLGGWTRNQEAILNEIIARARGCIQSSDVVYLGGKEHAMVDKDDLEGIVRLCQEIGEANKLIAEEESRLSYMVKKLSRIATEYDIAPFKLGNVAGHCRKLVEKDSQFQCVEIDYQGSPHTIRLDSDERALIQVYLNAMYNSVQHGNATKIWIREEVIDGQVHIYISDNGRGMSPEVHRRFLDVACSSKEAGGGVPVGQGGLVMKRIIKRLGGEIEAKTAMAKGTEIHIVLPDARYEP